MTVLERVEKLVRSLAPNAICDDCVADRLDLSVRQHANHKTRELSARPQFARSKGRCALGDQVKLVIHLKS